MTAARGGGDVTTNAVNEARWSLAALVGVLAEDRWREHKDVFENAVSAMVGENLDLQAENKRLSAALAQAEARAGRCGALLEGIAANWHLLMHPRPLLSGDVRGEVPACDYYPCPASRAARVAPDGERPAGTEGERRPTVVCLCGSTRFWRDFRRAGLEETMAGRIVLSLGAATGTDDEHFARLPPAEFAAIKARLEELHLRKIDLADEILVLNVNGYVGESTARELAYARSLGKRVRWLEPEEAVPAPRAPDGERPAATEGER